MTFITPEKLRVTKSKFDFTDLNNANLDGTRIEDSTFDYAESYLVYLLQILTSRD